MTIVEEVVIEDAWRVSRKICREVLDDVGIKLPINLVLYSVEFYIKWMNWVQRN